MITRDPNVWVAVAVLIDDPSFIPCREERCSIFQLHRQHLVTGMVRGRQSKRCPNCGGKLTQAPRKNVRCQDCPWMIAATRNRPKKRKPAKDFVVESASSTES